MDIRSIHHVSLTASDLERSKQFYSEILRLREIDRPPFDFAGAWFQVSATQQLHLIVCADPTFRGAKSINSRDVHFAVRVGSYREALEFLRSKGYREDADSMDLKRMNVNLKAVAGFPQIFILDPDRHVIEINAERLD
jgi:glyoxylase I family protein